MNVVLFGDFFQFPPVTGRALYNTVGILTEDERFGRALFEQFDNVVILKDQIRVQDQEWTNILRAARHGACNPHTHLPIIRSLVLELNPEMRPDFSRHPWNHTVLVTSRHALRTLWNARCLKNHCRQNNTPLFISPAEDTIKRQGQEPRLLTADEKAISLSKDPKSRKLSDTVELAVGMPCMVTMNVKTEHDLANGTRGVIHNLILDPKELEINPDSNIVHLQYPPKFILFKPDETHAANLPGLPEGVFPVEPMTTRYTIEIGGKKVTVERRQLPITGGYAFTDYRSQAQTLVPVLVDLAKPPTGSITPFGAYVALSRGRGRETIRLLRDFEDKLFTTHPSESLRRENIRLEELHLQTKQKENHV